MATSAFKSTTKRTSIGAAAAAVNDSASSNRSSAHRRSRSLSRFSHRIPAPAADDFDEVPAPKGRFVNTVRGSGFPEISLDDLAVEFFGSGDRGRSASCNSEASPASGGSSAAQRRGRSVSRQGSKLNGGGDAKGSVSSNSGGGGRLTSDNGANSRRRRSVSGVRYQISDSESDLDHSQKRYSANPKSFSSGNSEIRSSRSHMPKASNHRQGLRGSFSQKDLRAFDDYSSQSSVLTDDEGRDAPHSSKNGIERTIRAVYSQKKAQHPTGGDYVNSSLYDAMRAELRHAVEEIRTEFEQALGNTKPTVLATDNGLLSNSSNVLHTVSSIRRNYSTKLEESGKRKQDLLSEIVLEEQRSRELSKIAKELLPDSKNSVIVDKPSQVGARRRSTDRNRMSKRLSEEAERYIEDFISNVEDTDISSLDGERSDTSSSLGGMMKTPTTQSPTMSVPLPVDTDGVLLPWLQWETGNDASPAPCMNKTEPPTTPKTMSFDAAQEATNTSDRINLSGSSRGSCSPGIMDSLPRKIVRDTGSNDGSKPHRFDMEEYLKRQSEEDFLFERFRQQQRISSGSLLLCNQMYF